MHLAVALDRPVVSIFGPTDPVWAGPYRRDGAVVRAELECSPCYLRQLSRCPNNHDCMKNVSAAAVIERIESTLRVTAPESRPAARPLNPASGGHPPPLRGG
jgi:ADP-heptose:LPS heptosyltransferase